MAASSSAANCSLASGLPAGYDSSPADDYSATYDVALANVAAIASAAAIG